MTPSELSLAARDGRTSQDRTLPSARRGAMGGLKQARRRALNGAKPGISQYCAFA